MIDFPTAKPKASVHQQQTAVSMAFGQMLRDLDAGNVERVRTGLLAMQNTLRPASGLQKRASQSGGTQYRPLFVLDCVLLADNLKALVDSNEDESSLLQTVVRQSCP